MRQQIIVYENEKEISRGKIANISIKHDAIITKSIELFDDEDPCIIHQSYVVKEYVDILLNIFKAKQVDTIEVKDYLKELFFLDYKELSNIKIYLKG